MVAIFLVSIMVPMSGFQAHLPVVSPFAPPANGNWTVSGTETYRDSHLIVNGNISITGSLVLDNTTLEVNSSGNSVSEMIVGSGASLVLMNGSSISGYDGSSYFMEILSDAYFEMNRSTISNCGIPDMDLEKGGIYTETSHFYVNESTIANAATGIIGVNSAINIRDSMIVECIEYGIYLRDDSTLNMIDSNITNIRYSGIRMEGSSADLHMVFFESCRGSILADLSDIEMIRTVITGLEDPAVEISSSSLEMTDCIPLMVNNDHLRVTQNIGFSTVDLLNTSLDRISVEDQTVVREMYRFDVLVKTNDGLPANLADVEVQGSDGKLQFQGLTDERGWIRDMDLVRMIHNSTGSYSMDPHELYVLYEGAQRSREFNMKDNFSVSIEVIILEPVIIIDSPQNNSFLPSRRVVVEGRIIEDRSITSFSMFLDGGPEIMLPNRREFEIPLTFGSDEEHDLRLRAMDSDGKFDEAFVHFGIDTVVPALQVTSPEDGTYTNDSIVIVQGTCEEGSYLTINDEAVPLTGGSFSYSVLLTEGANEITVKATDRAGNVNTILRNVILDITPPRILITRPTNGTKIRTDSIIVEGSISHDTEVLTINGMEVPFDISGFSYKLEGLSEGRNRILVHAVDRTGSSSSKLIIVTVDTLPPSLNMAAIPAFTNKKDLVVNGTTDPGSTVLVNGIPARLDGEFFSGMVDLYVGSNNISISAMDEVGNTLTLFRIVYLDLEKPTFEQISPLDRSTFKKMVITISGRVYDDSGIAGIYGSNGTDSMELLSREEEFEWVVNLVPGINLFNIKVIDLAGNSRMTVINYTYDTSGAVDDTDPFIFITKPSSNITVEEGDLNISGTAGDDRSLSRIRYRINDGGWIELTPAPEWEFSIDLSGGVHVIEVQAIDSSGNIGTDTVKVTVVTRTETNGGDEGSNLSKVLRNIFIIIIIIALTAVVFLFMRNQRLRQEWDERKREMEEDRSKRRRGPPGRRRPSDRPPRTGRTGMDRERTRKLPDVEENS